MIGPARHQFVLFGSSIVQLSFGKGGWGSILTDIYSRKADIVLRGYNGWNTRRAVQVLDQVFPKDASLQPSLVIVYFGGNDSTGLHSSGLGPHVPLDEYVVNMTKIVTHITSLSETTRLIVLTCPPLNEVKFRNNTSGLLSEAERTNEVNEMYSKACVTMCKEMGVKVIDLFSAIQRTADWMEVCFTDGIHLSAQGSKIVALEILKVIEEADWKPSLWWKSIPAEFGDDSPYDLVAADGKSTLNLSEHLFNNIFGN